MSDETWRQEFYPIEASALAAAVGDEPVALTEHSLRKWRGLRTESLAKHELTDIPIDVDCSTCALCARYLRSRSDSIKSAACEMCPLQQHLGRVCDWDETDDAELEDGNAVDDLPPFAHFTMEGDPEPMIRALEGTLVMLTGSAASARMH